MPSERPAKRVRQACEPCRRKKSKCPGEQPVCSHCARLRQVCVYAGQRCGPSEDSSTPSVERTSVSVIPETDVSRKWEDRFASLEAKVAEVLETLGRQPGNNTTLSSTHSRRDVSRSYLDPGVQISASTLPPPGKVASLAELYLLYCDCQPLPLFHRASFISSLVSRDPEVIYAVLALSIRFSETPFPDENDPVNVVNKYAEVARALVIRRVSEGPVELSTLQCLCLLSLVDFTNGNTHRSSIHSSLAMNLAQCANLGSEAHIVVTDIAREERRRCFWSICLLKRLHGEVFSIPDISESFLPFPQSTGRPPDSCLSENRAVRSRPTNSMKDEGIVGYVIILSEVFSKTARYVRRRGIPSHAPPWSPQSEYSKIIALQMEMETRMPYTHRFKCANLADRSIDDLQSNRDYWGPWFLNQFMYHTILCLLNHPLLLSLSLRNYRSTIPEIFLQHTSDLISSHTHWIIHFINFFEEKSFKVSDPFLGYSAAVVATIELQLSFTEDISIRKDKQDRFAKCVNFVRGFGEQWPHMVQLADKLEKLEGAVSASYQPNQSAQNQSLLIDLSRFWEILEYSSGSSPGSARHLFGESLYSGPDTSTAEVSNTSPLPEPTRLSSPQVTPRLAPQHPNYISSSSAPPAYLGGPVASSQPLEFANDEFSILAENFFSQGQDFLRGVDDWPNMGNF